MDDGEFEDEKLIEEASDKISYRYSAWTEEHPPPNELLTASVNALMHLSDSARHWYWSSNAHTCPESGKPRGYTLLMEPTAPIPSALLEQSKMFHGVCGVYLPSGCRWQPDPREKRTERLSSGSLLKHADRVTLAVRAAFPEHAAELTPSMRNTFNTRDAVRAPDKEEVEEEEDDDQFGETVRCDVQKFVERNRMRKAQETREGAWVHEFGREGSGAFAGIYSTSDFHPSSYRWRERLSIVCSTQLDSVARDSFSFMNALERNYRRAGNTEQDRRRFGLASAIEMPEMRWARAMCQRSRERGLYSIFEKLGIELGSDGTPPLHLEPRLDPTRDELPQFGETSRLQSHFAQYSYQVVRNRELDALLLHAGTVDPSQCIGPPVRCDYAAVGLSLRVAGSGVVDPLMPLWSHRENMPRAVCNVPALSTGFGRFKKLNASKIKHLCTDNPEVFQNELPPDMHIVPYHAATAAYMRARVGKADEFYQQPNERIEEADRQIGYVHQVVRLKPVIVMIA